MTDNIPTHSPDVVAGITTSWLGVGSAWPSVEQCATAMYNNAILPELWPVAYDPFYGQNVDTTLTCLPPAVTSWWYGQTAIPQHVTSLGPVVCPEMYTTAETRSLNSISTFVACCPSDYGFHGLTVAGGLGQCRSTYTSGQALTMMVRSNSLARFQLQTVTVEESGDVSAVPVNGYIFASTSTGSSSSAVVTKTSTSSSSTAVVTSTSQTTTSSKSSSLTSSVPFQKLTLEAPSPTPTQPPTFTHPASSQATSQLPTVKDHGLSVGAKVGIGIGVSLTVVGVCCIIGAFLFVRRNKRKRDTKVKDESDSFNQQPDSLEPTSGQNFADYTEMDASQIRRHELS